MKYYDYDLLPFQLHVIRTDRFKTVQVDIRFRREVKKEEISKRAILSGVLATSTKKYPTERMMSMKRQELYSAEVGCVSSLTINDLILRFHSEFLNPKYTEEGMMKETLDFLISMIMEPNVEEGKFDEEVVNRVKKRLKHAILTEQENNAYIAEKRLLQELAPDTPLSYSAKGYIEDIDAINGENLYQYYLEVLKKDRVEIYVCGDMEPEKLKNYFLDSFKIQTVKKPYRSKKLTHKTFRKRTRSVVEKKQAKQSNLVIGCKIEGLTPYEMEYVAPLYTYIFGGGMNSKLFQVVREKHSLCYSIHSNIFSLEHVMLIRAGIDASNYKKTVEYVKKLMKEMEKGKFDDTDIQNFMILYTNSCDEIYDSQFAILNNYIGHLTRKFDLIEDKKKNVQKLNRNMILKLAKKIHLDTVFLLEGEMNHE